MPLPNCYLAIRRLYKKRRPIPIVTVTAPATANTNSAVTLSATASIANGDTIQSVQFQVNGSNVGAADTVAPYTTNAWTPTTPGTFTITAIATGTKGGSATSEPVTVTVSTPAAPIPTVTVTAPATAIGGQVINLTASASVSGDTISQVQFRVNGINLNPPDTTSPFATSWTVPNVSGNYVISAEAIGNLGGVAVSSGVTVEVTVNLPFVSITTQATQTPTANHFTIGTAQNGFMLYSGQVKYIEPYFDVWIKRGARATQRVRLYGSQSRFIKATEGEVISLGTTDGRALTVCNAILPEVLPTITGTTGTANCDRAGEPIWNPSAPHIVLPETQRYFSVVGDSSDRIIFIKEYDGTNWSPTRFYWLPASTAINIVCAQRRVAIANYDGVALSLTAPTGSTIGGTSQAMTLDIPAVTGTSHAVSNVTQLKAAIAAAVKGDEIVLAAGTYVLDVNVGHATFAANNGRAHGILIRGATGNRADVVIQAGSSIGFWDMTSISTDVADCASFKDLSFNWNGQAGSITIRGGIWKFQNVRFYGTGADDCISGVMDAGRRLLVDFLNCSADTSGADCWNFNGLLGDAETPFSQVRLINCVGHTAGTGASNQCVTTHSTMHIEIWGGHYYNADTNIFAPDLGIIQHAFFTKCEKGSRNAGIRGTNLYGCLLTQNGDITRLNYAMFNKGSATGFRNAVLSGEGTFQFEVLNNFMQGTSGRCVFYSIGDQTGALKTSISGNVIKGFATNNILCGFYSSGSTTEVKVWNNTSTGSDIELRDQLTINSRNNATSTYDATSSAANLDSNYITAAAYTAYTPKTNDVTGALALDARDFPTTAGNLDANGLDIYSYVGGSDWQGLPFIYEPGKVSRGARAKPIVGNSTVVFPDAY